MSRRQRQVEVDTGPQDDWIWGNQRGGGGAPIKDTAGNQINNLKKVVKGDVVVDTSPKAQGRRAISFKEELRPSEDHYEYNYRSKSFRDDKRNNRPPIDDRAQNIQQVPMHAPASPRKFMGALQSMHGNNQENQAKLRLLL